MLILINRILNRTPHEPYSTQVIAVQPLPLGVKASPPALQMQIKPLVLWIPVRRLAVQMGLVKTIHQLVLPVPPVQKVLTLIAGIFVGDGSAYLAF